MMKEALKGALVAAAVGSLLAAGAARAEGASKEKKDKASASAVKCAGINECKGKGGCASAKNDCAGKNGCKGQGVTDTKTEKECTDKGGKVTAQK